MDRSQSSRGIAAFIVALALMSVVAVMATGVVGRTGTPAPTPSEVPGPTPSAHPSAQPSASPTVPSGVFDVDLDIATAHDVSVIITDATATVVGASSGRAGDGMSVRWHDVGVENVDDSTVRITWVGLPVDDTVRLSVTTEGDRIHLGFVETLPYPDSDAMGADRVLIIAFDSPVAAEDVTASFAD